jgi:hypothetical protein
MMLAEQDAALDRAGGDVEESASFGSMAEAAGRRSQGWSKILPGKRCEGDLELAGF